MLYSTIQDMNQQSVRILESTREMARHLQSINGQARSVAPQISELQKISALPPIARSAHGKNLLT